MDYVKICISDNDPMWETGMINIDGEKRSLLYDTDIHVISCGNLVTIEDIDDLENYICSQYDYYYIFDTDELIETDELFYTEYALCHDCDELCRSDEMYQVDGSYLVCEDCSQDYARCYDCGDLVSDEYLSWVGDTAFCSYCFDRRRDNCEIMCCENCGEYFFDDDGCYGPDDCWYCNGCFDDMEFEDDNISDYHSSYHTDLKSSFIDGYEARERHPRIGFELEIDRGGDNDRMASWIDDNLTSELVERSPYVMFEHDGSLDNGFEIISRPAMLRTHLSYNWKDVMSEIVSRGYLSHSCGTCGLHTHIDRRYFGSTNTSQELAIAKLLFIFERHWNNMLRFSRRNHSNIHWCKRNSEDGYYKGIKSSVKNGQSDRYLAINLRTYDTVEIRLWRGTLKYSTFMATLKFTDRLVRLAKNTPVKQLYEMSWEDILGDDADILTYWDEVKNREI